jgi:hypothetical protein
MAIFICFVSVFEKLQWSSSAFKSQFSYILIEFHILLCLLSGIITNGFVFQEFLKALIGFIDVAGLYFALTQLTHRNISQNHKFQAVGLGMYMIHYYI